MCWNLADIVEGVRAAGSLCPVLYQLHNPHVIFEPVDVGLSQADFISVLELVLCYRSCIYTTLAVLLKVQLQCAVDTMQGIYWQVPVAGFQ